MHGSLKFHLQLKTKEDTEVGLGTLKARTGVHKKREEQRFGE